MFRSLLARTPTEVPLILEETEIGRAAENIFTEDINYYRVDGEDKLTKLDDLNLFFTEECYIIRWDYRVEKEGQLVFCFCMFLEKYFTASSLSFDSVFT